MSLCENSWMLLWQLAITSEMAGLETCAALLILMMVTNIQTLGAPISYTSIPGTISACISFTLIVSFAFVADSRGRTKIAKAKIIGLTSFVEFLGLIFVLLANVYKLFSDGNQESFATQQLRSSIISTHAVSNNLSNFNLMTSETPGFMSTTNKSQSTNISSSTNLHSFSHTPKIVVHYKYNLSTQTNGVGINHEEILLNSDSKNVYTETLEGEDHIPWNAFLAMAGYTLIDSGYDTTNCFLKTFILDCTPPDFHARILIKLVLMSSIGGVLTTSLGSSDLAMTLTLGTNLDPNAAMCIALATLSLILMVVGTSTTILTGLLWKPPIRTGCDDLSQMKFTGVVCTDERTPLAEGGPSNGNLKSLHDIQIALVASSSSFDIDKELNTQDKATVLTPTSTLSNNDDSLSLKDSKTYLLRHKQLILVSILGFLLSSVNYAYQVYSANFLGEAVFGGDPSAAIHTPEYLAYLRGVSVASLGLLIIYISCSIVNIFHEKILSWTGWKVEALVVLLLLAVICLVMAITRNLWLYYLSAVWFGSFRAVAQSLPYILVNKLSFTEDGGKKSGFVIATVSSMVPVSILACSTSVGPIIDITDEATTSVYLTCACAILGCFTILFITI